MKDYKTVYETSLGMYESKSPQYTGIYENWDFPFT